MNQIPFSNQYITLGKTFYTKTSPSPVTSPEMVGFNENLCEVLGLSSADLNSSEGTAVFAGNLIPDGAEPLAMAYAGHQFGHFNPQLGDGRAILLGELVGPDGNRFDMQLKGSGRTFYSRDGDGRAALGPVLREYLVSEAMAKLGLPTTRALAAVTTGEDVARERLLPGGIITRIATSFVRVGTFEYFSSRGDVEAIHKLADFVIDRNYPQARDSINPYVALLKGVVDKQAALIAQWMQLGFIHGVMNTDNMSIAGETIDYGPCAFMDAYDHDQVFSSIDRHGRYAYSNQPSIGLWNLTRLAESLLPLLAENTEAAVAVAKDVLKTYVETYDNNWLACMRSKCGLTENTDETSKADDKVLIEELFNIMAENNADFTLTFFYLSRLSSQGTTAQDRDIRSLFDNPAQFDNWTLKWRKRFTEESISDEERQAKMCAVNPVYIPRNHQIEAAIRAAEDNNDFSVFHALHDVLQDPYVQQEGKEDYMLPPKPDEVVKQTFCGT
ncbi:MAG: YdiU family protein [Gammaproteobacteria bacterium]|nr:MAG: YdiU family protein [Gammaproteobacteria bacterium]